jgi:hypothetical protein
MVVTEPHIPDIAPRSDDPAPPADRGAAWYAGPVPAQHRVDRLLFTRLTVELVREDYEAVMATADHLRWWSASTWPTDDFTLAENAQDLQWHDDEHRDRVAFTYSVLDAATFDAGHCRVVGCVYIRPFSTACSTRGVACPPELLARADAVARGWLIDEFAAQRGEFTDAVLAWLCSDAWQLPGVWWQERLDDKTGDGGTTPIADRVVGDWSFRQGVR